MKEKEKKTFFCKGEQEYVTCAHVLSRGNAMLTQKNKGEDQGQRQDGAYSSCTYFRNPHAEVRQEHFYTC